MDYRGQGRGRVTREDAPAVIQTGGKGAGRWSEVAGFLQLSPSAAALGPLSLGSFCHTACSFSSSLEGISPRLYELGLFQGSSQQLSVVSGCLYAADAKSSARLSLLSF